MTTIVPPPPQNMVFLRFTKTAAITTIAVIKTMVT